MVKLPYFVFGNNRNSCCRMINVKLDWPRLSHPGSCHVHHIAGWLTHTLHWHTHTRSQSRKEPLWESKTLQLEPVGITSHVLEGRGIMRDFNLRLLSFMSYRFPGSFSHPLPSYSLLAHHTTIFVRCTGCCDSETGRLHNVPHSLSVRQNSDSTNTIKRITGIVLTCKSQHSQLIEWTNRFSM